MFKNVETSAVTFINKHSYLWHWKILQAEELVWGGR